MEQKTQNTALLVMDMQLGIIGNFVQGAPGMIDATRKAIDHAREQKMPVLFITVGFRRGESEVRPNNKGLAAVKERVAKVDMNEFTTVIPELGRREDEPLVKKCGLSAFAGSDLEIVLRSYAIQHLVLAGISTNGVVLSTMREAVDKDYRITVLADCCADADEEVQKVLTNKVFPRHADVMTAAEWVG
jgi:nicotinamidase-related amidase